MTKKVLILGCGPAGLIAAQAVVDAGLDPIIVSKKRKSEMFGAQYLHQPIPGVSPRESFRVEYRLEGKKEDYAEKVYGKGFIGKVSPDELDYDHEGWDIRSTYDTLWNRFADEIEHTDFQDPREIHEFLGALMVSHYISTIPAPMLCVNPSHLFHSQMVWAVGDAPERGVFSPIKQDLNTVVCNGEKDTAWYRAANILGFHTVEWPLLKKPPIEGLASVEKPVSTNCDCAPFVHRLGRYGRWTKGVLSHESYYAVRDGLNESEKGE